MQVLKNFNNISEQLREECIPEFNKGDIKAFRMLNGVQNNDPDITERMKRPVFYPDTQIRTWDRIFDPYLKKEGSAKSGGFVDIGVVETFDITTERPTKFKLLVRGQGVGMFHLNGSIIEDRETFEFLCISNENANFKYRDEKVSPLFEIIEQVDAVEESDKDFDLLLNAGTALKKLNTVQKRQLSILLHIDPLLDDKTLSNKLTEYAKGSPSELIERIKHLRTTASKKEKVKREEEVLT